MRLIFIECLTNTLVFLLAGQVIECTDRRLSRLSIEIISSLFVFQ